MYESEYYANLCNTSSIRSSEHTFLSVVASYLQFVGIVTVGVRVRVRPTTSVAYHI